MRYSIVFGALVVVSATSFLACGSSSSTCHVNCDNGDDGDTSGAGAGSGSTGATSGASTGSGGCIGCSDYLADSGLPHGAACTDDGPPSSATLVASLQECACGAGPCAEACADGFCAGNGVAGACGECMLSSCEGVPECANLETPATTSSTSTGSSTSSGGPCATCFEVITGNGSVQELCTDDGPPTSYDNYFALVACACDGACLNDCGDNLCATGSIGGTCQTCLLDSEAGCGVQASACAGNGGP